MSSEDVARIAVPERLLELLAQRVGVPLSLDAASEAAQLGRHADWRDSLTHSARRAGLRVLAFEIASADELVRVALLGTPAVGRVGERWVIVRGVRRGGVFDVVILDALGEHRQRLRAKALTAWLTVHQASLPMAWMAVEPRLMLASTERIPNHYKRLLKILRLERYDIAVALVFGVALGVASLAVPIAAQSLVNIVASTSMVQPLVTLGLILLIALAAVGGLQVMQTVVAERVHQRLWVRTTNDWIRRLPRYTRDARQRNSAHELANRFFDVCLLQKATVSFLLDGSALVLTTFASLVLLAFYHPWLLVFDLVLIVGVLGVVLSGWSAGHHADEESFCKYDLFAWIDDVAGGRVLFADARGRAFADARGELLLRKWLGARGQYFRRILRQTASGVLVQIAAIVGLLTMGGYLVVERELTFGQLVASSVLITTVGAGLVRIGRHLDPLYESAAVAATFAKNLDEPLEAEGGIALPERPAGLSVELVERQGSKSVFKLGSGERLALVGGSGAHSRVLDLLFGLYGASSHPRFEALLDGFETRALDPESLRSQVALVRGREIVWASVRQNLDLGQGSDDAAMLELLELVGMRSRVLDLPQGLDTLLIGDGDGGPLDENELRRLVLVRALLAQPRLLLLDRALDCLDLGQQARARLLDWVFSADRPWTVVVVTSSLESEEILARCSGRLEIADRPYRGVRS